MLFRDLSAKEAQQSNAFVPEWAKAAQYALLCSPEELERMQPHFQFDESTVLECTNLDESVRLTSYDGYDFISLVCMGDAAALHEINLYLSARYLIVVLPKNPCWVSGPIRELVSKEGSLAKLFYRILSLIFFDYSNRLERLEDKLAALQDDIVHSVKKAELVQLNDCHKLIYTIKKQLRASAYIGAQILVNENQLIDKKSLRYFQNINAQMLKLYDFSASLHEMSDRLLQTYEGRLTAKTNEAVNKLTILTVFFGPLTVITGIYGMNFNHMPELQSPWGYPLSLAAMGAITLLIYWILKRKEWL